ncbi:DNA mismatch repair protein [Haplosporangium sp. Z 27]|nr:DNA mismatch repair protein [Haplosporangium sp. Z 27]
MASIKTLSPGVAEELRASLVINSLEQCATELIQNSIDANASSIEIKIDIAAHSLQVSDNGDGITSTDMEHIGTHYATSKCSTLQDLGLIKTYGFRGEAIAAIAEMSLVDIVSYPRNQKHAFSTIFKGGDRLYCGRSSKYPRFNHGTTVSVRDLFYKYPVRQSYWSEASVSKLDFQLEKVRRAVETLALIAPRVSFTLIDLAKDTKVMNCRKADSQLNRITSILGQALSSSLVYVKSMDDNSYRFSGYISTTGHHNRLYQYIFLNNRPINNENLNRAMAQLFAQSSFSKDRPQYEEDLRRSRERHPVYILVLKCAPCLYDICADPSKVTLEFEDEERVLYIVRDTIITFLERQHLLSRSAATTLRKQTTTRKRKSRAKLPIGNTRDSIPFSVMPHVKSSRPSKTSEPFRGSLDVERDSEYDSLDIEDELEFELDADWMSTMLSDDFVSSEVDYNRQSDTDVMVPSTMSERTSLPHAVKSRSRTFNTGTSGIWAQDALRKWVNPVFPTPPSQIPALRTWSQDLLLQGELGYGQSIDKNMSRFFSMSTGQHNNFNIKNLRLTKSCLQRAKVIAQLDRKFILCLMESTSPTMQDNMSFRMAVLAVIDQHAADERVRVERLMKEMCACSFMSESPLEASDGISQHSLEHRLDSITLIPPIPITMSKREWNLAKQYSDWLYRWGIVLKSSGNSTGNEYAASGRSPGMSSSIDDLPDAILVSHHFNESASSADEESGCPSVCRFNNQQERHSSGKSTAILGNRFTPASDYIQGWVATLPRIVADRCVVDTTLTQDLIKDSVSWAEECRFSGGGSTRDETQSMDIDSEGK